MKAIISTGNKQYLVSKNDEIEIDLIPSDKKSLSFEPLLLIDGDSVLVGTPTVAGHSVAAELITETRGEKVLAIRYKAKKRVNKVKGFRPTYSKIKITAIK